MNTTKNIFDVELNYTVWASPFRSAPPSGYTSSGSGNTYEEGGEFLAVTREQLKSKARPSSNTDQEQPLDPEPRSIPLFIPPLWEKN